MRQQILPPLPRQNRRSYYFAWLKSIFSTRFGLMSTAQELTSAVAPSVAAYKYGIHFHSTHTLPISLLPDPFVFVGRNLAAFSI